MVEIYGGFGNQVFQLAFAQYLKNLGIEVEVNTRDFARVSKENSEHLTARKLVLPVENFDLDEIQNLHYFNYRIRREARKSPFLNRLLNSKTFSLMGDKTFNLDSLKEKNYLIGHWQDLNILDNARDHLIMSLSKNANIKKALNGHKSENTLIHVRRSDYLKFNEELPILYYEKAINFVKSKAGSCRFTIYTDDINWCKKQSIFNSAEEILSSSDSPQDTIDTFCLMLQNKHFIIANSTFSLIAAYFGKNSESIVTYPYPWFRSRNYNEKLVDKNWERVNY